MKTVKLEWVGAAMFQAIVKRDARRLGVFLQPRETEWSVLALETSDGVDAAAVLEDHAHKIVGFYPDVRAAFDAAESFAAHWLAGAKQTQAADCECTDIEKRTIGGR